MSVRTWRWSKTEGLDGGSIRLTPHGLIFEVDDDFYNGELSREAVLDIARAIIAQFDDREGHAGRAEPSPAMAKP